jgi:hypothetical protein
MIPAVLTLQVVERSEIMTSEAAIASPGSLSLQTSSAATSFEFSAATHHEPRRSRQ